VTDQELRAIVRDTIARHGRRVAAGPGGDAGILPPATALRQHPSHGLCSVPAGGDAEGPCIIEPAVQCNHCGYCKSYGH
jgi:hypothetical protein